MWLYPSPLSAAIQLLNGCRIYPLSQWTPSKLYRSLFFFFPTHSTAHLTVTVLLQKVSKCVLVVLAYVPQIYTTALISEETRRLQESDGWVLEVSTNLYPRFPIKPVQWCVWRWLCVISEDAHLKIRLLFFIPDTLRLGRLYTVWWSYKHIS